MHKHTLTHTHNTHKVTVPALPGEPSDFSALRPLDDLAQQIFAAGTRVIYTFTFAPNDIYLYHEAIRYIQCIKLCSCDPTINQWGCMYIYLYHLHLLTHTHTHMHVCSLKFAPVFGYQWMGNVYRALQLPLHQQQGWLCHTGMYTLRLKWTAPIHVLW